MTEDEIVERCIAMHPMLTYLNHEANAGVVLILLLGRDVSVVQGYCCRVLPG
jgi:hypothetical protein